ncbi:MAG: hypothetical protein M1834_004916 [Cirrosporium novae-zelandiae]|nr:MAG: hypothetical protein M1834_004916 [Cirrosporium novae-zelandiae]
MSEEDEYRHEQSITEPGKIRLLTLHPANPNANIQISFRVVKLSKPDSEYDALSYTWGDPKPPGHKIFVQSNKKPQHLQYLQPIHITENLYAALKHLRHKNEARSLWVDALCINQERGNAEKGKQIEQMDKIFNNAKEVYVWLGQSDETSDMAMEFIREVASPSKFERLITKDENCDKWKALTKLMTRPWFSRRWVVQEIALAKSVSLCCGRKRIRWSKFADAVGLIGSEWPRIRRLLTKNRKAFLGDTHALGASALVELSNNLLRTADDGKTLVRLATLEYLVSNLTTFNVTEPHDMIYSLLALAKDTQNGEIQVHYSKSVDSLCAKVVKLSIRTSNSLDIICRPWASVEDKSLPSWVCSASKHPFSIRFVDRQFERQNGDLFIGNPDKRIYNAGGIAKRSDYKIQAAPILSVCGVVFDKAGTFGGIAEHATVPARWLKLAKWKNVTEDNIPEAFCRTLVADRGSDGNRPPTWYGNAAKRAWTISTLDSSPTPTLDMGKILRQGHLAPKIKEFLLRVQATIFGRKFVVTEDRKRFGLGPRNMKLGDLICVLKGCSVPVVLRPSTVSQGTFTVIGEAYIDGVMDGELMESEAFKNREWFDLS